MSFGEEVKNIRKDKKMTLKELSERSKITESYLSRIENGKRGIPHPETVKRIAKGLSVSHTLMLEKAGYLEEGEYDRRIDMAKEFNDPEFQKKLKNATSKATERAIYSTPLMEAQDIMNIFNFSIDSESPYNLKHKNEQIDKEEVKLMREVIAMLLKEENSYERIKSFTEIIAKHEKEKEE